MIKNVVIDTDAFNEIDDQFAISYLLANGDKLNTVALYAAPFLNSNSVSPEDGMIKSYEEIKKLLKTCGRSDLIEKTFKGSNGYLKDESTPVISAAAQDLASRAMGYTSDNPLNVVAIGAITNVASAVLLNPEICDKIRLIWLGGHAEFMPKPAYEFNMMQDIFAARVVMSKISDFVRFPCDGAVSEFRISKPELERFLLNKNKIGNYLAETTIKTADSYAYGTDWTRVIWDVTPVAYLLNDGDKFMLVKDTPLRLPLTDGSYEFEPPTDKTAKTAIYIKRDELMNDLINKILTL